MKKNTVEESLRVHAWERSCAFVKWGRRDVVVACVAGENRRVIFGVESSERIRLPSHVLSHLFVTLHPSRALSWWLRRPRSPLLLVHRPH
jgi:hypothetical protein